MKLFLATLGICLGAGMVAVLLSAANTAVPTIRADLAATLLQMQWAVNMTALTRGSLVATIGRLADMFGRRRLFLAGLVLLIVSSLMAGFSPNVSWLIGAMALVGVGSATQLAVSQALLVHAYPPQQMGRALAFWTLSLGLGIATGSVLAGVVLEFASWHWVFFLTIPFALVAYLLTRLFVDESRDQTRETRVDWLGLLLLVVGSATVVTAIIEGPRWGWTSWPILTLFSVGVISYIGFLLVEMQVKNPLLELKLFANRMFIAGAVTNFCFMCYVLTALFLIPLFMNLSLGAAPIAIGLAFLGLAVPVTLLSPLAGLLNERWGPKPQVLAGLLVLIGAALWMTRLGTDSQVIDVALPLISFGVGWALLQSAAATAAIGALPPELSGSASGGFVMMGGFGGSIGLAVGGTIVRSVYAADLNALPSPAAFADGFHAGMWFLVGMSAFAFFFATLVLKGRRAFLFFLLFAAIPLHGADGGFAAGAHERHRANQQPVTLGVKYGIDVLANPIGGLRQGLANASSLGGDVTAEVSGVEIYASAVWRSGQSLSENFIGNAFSVQQLFGGSNARFNELYARVNFCNGCAAIKVGRMNAGNDMLTSPLYYWYVLNGIDGNPVAITFNTPFFVYQDAQWGAFGFAHLHRRLKVKGAAYIGNRSVAENRYHGFNWTFAAPQGYMFLVDATYLTCGGHYTLGAYYVTRPTVDFAQHLNGGNPGLYLQVDQTILCRFTPWAAMIVCPSDRNEFPLFFDFGLVARGLFPGRPCDRTNFGFVYGRYSRHKPGNQDYEINLEVNHWFHLWKNVDFVPVVQYIIRPSGLKHIANAWTVGFQLSAVLW